MSAGANTAGSAPAGFPGAGFCAKGFWAATACGRAMPSPRTATSNRCARISRSLERLFAPGRNDVIHPGVGDQLTKMLVQIAADAQNAVSERHVAAHDLALAGQRRRVECFE